MLEARVAEYFSFVPPDVPQEEASQVRSLPKQVPAPRYPPLRIALKGPEPMDPFAQVVTVPTVIEGNTVILFEFMVSFWDAMTEEQPRPEKSKQKHMNA